MQVSQPRQEKRGHSLSPPTTSKLPKYDEEMEDEYDEESEDAYNAALQVICLLRYLPLIIISDFF